MMFVWNVLKVALGLGFVIFLHELGHFLLAKWNGVKVEKFSIGFGPTLASYRRGVGMRIATGSNPPGPDDPPTIGETEYILAALPLGGYVKMLGESREEGETQSEAATNPRAFHNKSVWARMQIITAGVIMNVFLGVACFAFVASQGGIEQPAMVGGVLPGSPAYKAGLRAGDEIVAIDGKRGVVYKNLLAKVNLSSAGQKIKFTIKGAGGGPERLVEIEPTRENGTTMPVIGIKSGSSLELASKLPFLSPPGSPTDPSKPLGGFQGGDKVVAVGPEGGAIEPVSDYEDFVAKTEPLRDRAIVVEVERKDPKAEPEAAPSRVKVTVPVHRFVDFGLRMTPGPVDAIRPGSPAESAGILPGDRIVAVDGKPYDPMHLPDLARASAGQPLKLTLERSAGGKPAESIELTVTPDSSPIWVETVDPLGRVTPLDIPGLGLAMDILAKVQEVREGSPASKAGIKPGAVIRSVIVQPEKIGKSTPKAVTFAFEPTSHAWPLAFGYLQEIPWTKVEIGLEGQDAPIAVTPESDPNWYHPLRGLEFDAMSRKTPPLGLADSLAKGVNETWENISQVFLIFQSLFQGRVGANAFGGAIPIAQIAYSQASSGWTPLIQFLGILSVNLAVLNFLPIPPLDGGQFVFLAAEKVRGKPLPDSILNYATFGGVVFVLLLIVFINGKDIFQLIQSYL
ncbi:site-2 protease family protein [Tundrisphaera lichenicola]|uniref:site-2 protease family protein n=1 Tax=Tundrisphaera lichenicola TaxID=2029860 RepID=UPI003EB9C32E